MAHARETVDSHVAPQLWIAEGCVTHVDFWYSGTPPRRARLPFRFGVKRREHRAASPGRRTGSKGSGTAYARVINGATQLQASQTDPYTTQSLLTPSLKDPRPSAFWPASEFLSYIHSCSSSAWYPTASVSSSPLPNTVHPFQYQPPWASRSNSSARAMAETSPRRMTRSPWSTRVTTAIIHRTEWHCSQHSGWLYDENAVDKKGTKQVTADRCL